MDNYSIHLDENELEEIEDINEQFRNEINNEIINEVDSENQLQQNLSIYQQNVNEVCKFFTNDIEMCFQVNPLIFLYNFDDYSYFNIGKKILAPKSMLSELSKYNNLEYPIHIEINNNIFTILDFLDYIDKIYIPTERFYNMNLIENEITTIKILKNIPKKASFLKLKPCSEKFYEIKDIKQYLEIHIQKLYPILSKDEIIKLPFKNETIELIIRECLPEDIVSLNEIEELEIDFEPLVDVQNIEEKIDFKQEIPDYLKQKQKQKKENEEEKKEEKPKGFVPFSGKGRRLCD